MKPRYVHVGSWNIENFGKEDDRNDENAYAIAEHIEMSGVHLLALQELHVTNDISDEDAILENDFLRKSLDLIEEHTGARWEYEIFRNRRRTDKSQLCGVAWNSSRIEKVGQALRIAVRNRVEHRGERHNVWDRHPHAVKFRALPGEDSDIELTDFVVVSLHMKANTDRNAPLLRKLEAEELLEHLQTIEESFDEKDIVFIGDTNCKRTTEDAIDAFIEHGFVDLNADDISTFYRGNSAPFDRVLVPAERRAFAYSRQYILRSANPLAHDQFLSDHYLIKTSIVVRRDAGS